MADRRRVRYARRATVARVGDHLAGDRRDWTAVPFARSAGCGRMLTADHAECRVKVSDDGPSAYMTGVSTCGSVWLCPVCSAKIRTRRQIEVETVAAAHVATGGTFGMLTLTVRHDASHRLSALLEAQNSAWRTIQQDYEWRRLRKGCSRGPRGALTGRNGDGSLVGFIRSKEITQGLATPGGSWHPHDHVLLLWGDELDHAGDVAWIEARWADLVDQSLGCRPDAHGFHYRAMGADSAAYVTKLAQEAARGDLKSGSRSVWHIIDALADGESWALRAWVEYATATKGKRAIQMSRGLRARYGLDPERSDEELAVDDVQGVLVDTIGPDSLRALMRAGYGETPPIIRYLEVVEDEWRRGLRGPRPGCRLPGTVSRLCDS